jgi:hypothetical protein
VNSQPLEDENVGLSKWRSQASRGREDDKNSGKREREGQSFEVWECQLEDVMTCRCGPFPICKRRPTFSAEWRLIPEEARGRVHVHLGLVLAHQELPTAQGK